MLKITDLIVKLENNWNVILLSGTQEARQPIELLDGGNLADKVRNSLTTSGYIVNSNYYDTLIENYTKSKEKLERGGKQSEYAIDVGWNELQLKDKWYAMKPFVGKQLCGWSDIENKNVDYNI